MRAAAWRWALSRRVMAPVGVVAGVVLFVCVNVLAHRVFVRWDWTHTKLYSLSPVTGELLKGIDEPVTVIALLAEGDPVTPSARQLLSAYAAQSSWVKLRFVDPDRNPVEVAALQSQYKLSTAAGGASWASGTSLVIVKGQKSWRVSADELMEFNEQEGRVQPRLEQAISSGIRNVMESEKRSVCFTRGHSEASIDSAGTEGLAAFRESLERNNFAVSELEFSPISPPASLTGCDIVVVAGPRIPFGATAISVFEGYLKQGGRLVLGLRPSLSDSGTVALMGLEGVLLTLGVELKRELIFEGSEEFILPLGIKGEAFLATPKNHEVTRTLFPNGEVSHRIVLQMPQSFESAANGRAVPLLMSSSHAMGIREPGRLSDPNAWKSVFEAGAPGERVLAVALEGAAETEPTQARAPRLVVVGSLAPFQDASLRDTASPGSRLFVDGTINWLSDAPLVVNVPQKPSHSADLNLTEESLTEVSRYVLLYMPGTALLIGLIVLFRRRAVEKASRQSQVGPS